MPEALASKSLMWLETFYKPDVRLPHGVIGPRDLAKLAPTAQRCSSTPCAARQSRQRPLCKP